MFLHSRGVAGKCFFVWLLFSLVANFTWAQSETATVSGQVVDPSGLNVTGAQVKLIDIDRDTSTSATTNNTGLYTLPSVRPGRYRIEVTAAGFKVVNVTGITINVQDHLEQNFKLVVGSASESITVDGAAPLVDTESAAVSTIVDRNFAENLPLNGRSFQTLIELTPGVVLTTSSTYSDGQFSVNGQRADSNYWMVDGVSANIGVSSGGSDTLSGSLSGVSAQGGTNSLVSVDAMQEFRIQTSTFAPEFGRTPGGQISIVTRSGTNQFHGTAFDYLRNDALDANAWFNGVNIFNATPLPKPEERQNDFGGTFSGPILKNRTFFFFSYEGLRLRLPQTGLSTVPDINARKSPNAIPAMQTFLNAYPLPNGPEVLDQNGNPTGTAAFNASYSNRSTLDATSLRVDHKLNDKLIVFGRYNYAPSGLVQRPGINAGTALSVVSRIGVPTQTITFGATWSVSPLLTNDLRANYSRVSSSQTYSLDDFGGAAPFSPSAVGLPSPYTSSNSSAAVYIASLNNPTLETGRLGNNLQRQFNLVDNVAIQKGSHGLKFGADYRRLTPSIAPPAYTQNADFFSLSHAQSGQLDLGDALLQNRVPLILQNLGLFTQDTWRALPRLTLTFGLRWDVDFTPRTSVGPSLAAVVNFNDLSTLALAPLGTPEFSTRYGNVAPRIGIAYQLCKKMGRESVLRGGWGIFYDLATTQLNPGTTSYPFGAFAYYSAAQFPIVPPPPPPQITSLDPTLEALDPQLKSPYTREWNVAFEQSLGAAQSLSISYVGAAGRHLLLTEDVISPNPNVQTATLVGNYGTSDYDALQLQFRRRLSRGLQALASYQWGHSIDTGSTGAGGLNDSDFYSRQLDANANRGPSDFDLRNSASLALTYDIPSPKVSTLAHAVLGNWATENVFQAHSAPPVDVNYPYDYLFEGASLGIRPDVTPGIPLYVYGSQYPGGKAFNGTLGAVVGGCSDGLQSVGPFCPPPIDPGTGEPIRQGDLGRNALRGFGAWEWDFAAHRDFPIRENLKIQFRAELFNVLNHPNFGPPSGGLPSLPSFSFFGISQQTLGQSLSAGSTASLSPLYQFGGPRSIQLAVKITF
jgi:Carboxypeptidase regulatory-like domain/TonB dependent receptor